MEETWKQAVEVAKDAKENFNDFYENRLVLYAADRIAELESANAALREERDAWMAHVERLAEMLWDKTKSLDISDGMMRDVAPHDVCNLLDEPPPISLAKRDARVKAGAMREAADQMITNPAMHDAALWLEGKAALIEAHADEMEKLKE